MREYCTFGEGYSAEQKICYTGCCVYDCCPKGSDASSSRDGGIWVLVLFLVLGMFLCSFVVCYCSRNRRRSFAGQTFYSVPTSTVTITTRPGFAGAPVPQHCGYDQSRYEPSTFPMPAYQPTATPTPGIQPSAPPTYDQYQPPPPYTEQPPKAKV